MRANYGPWGRRRGLLAATLALAAATSARAQTPMAGDSIHAAKTLFTWRDAALAGGFTALTFAMFPIDRSTAQELQDSTTQASRFLRSASRNVQYIADPGSVVIGLSMYGIGRIAGWREVADLGLHGTEAVALSGTVTYLLKGLAGRARPNVTLDTNAHDFSLGRGFSRGNGYSSFPSGHTSAAFAAASVVTSESQRWWPDKTWVVGPVMYGGAVLVGLSRMYNNAHWASDVVLGAAIGTFSGIKVVRYSHGHTGNIVDRVFLGAYATPSRQGGADVGFSFSP